MYIMFPQLAEKRSVSGKLHKLKWHKVKRQSSLNFLGEKNISIHEPKNFSY